MAAYRLFIQKHHCPHRNGKKQQNKILFAVVDLDKGQFPGNFVCMFPKNFVKNSAFCENFEEPGELAIELLTKAKAQYTDEEVLREIQSRMEQVEVYIAENDIEKIACS